MIDVHEFEAEDTTVNADEHNICFDRTVRNGVTAEVVTDLYLINDKDQRVKVDSNKENRYIQEGNKEVIIPYELPDGIVVGEYRYIMVTEVELANGRVTRAFEFESKPFTVSKEENTTQQISNSC
jgi:protein-tyrosine phosphatase